MPDDPAPMTHSQLSQPFLVSVTQADIDGPREDPRSQNCPIARALRQATGHDVSVGALTCSVLPSSTRAYYYSLPNVATDFIHNYDLNRSPVCPFTFTLEPCFHANPT